MKPYRALPVLLIAAMLLILSACGASGASEKSPSSDTSVIPSSTPAQETVSPVPSVSLSAAPEPAVAYADLYRDYIDRIIQSSSGTEDGRLVCLKQGSGPAWDGKQQRLLYDRYGIDDIDGDGNQELVLLYTDRSENELNVLSVLRYSPERKEISPVVTCYFTADYSPGDLLFLNNGIIALQHSGNEAPTYLFTQKAVADRYDFSGKGLLSQGYLLQFNKHVDPQGNLTLTEDIIGTFDVPVSRDVSVEAANLVLSELESGTITKVILKSFSGAPDVAAGEYY